MRKTPHSVIVVEPLAFCSISGPNRRFKTPARA
jgi:hypothetical protein